MRSKVINTAVIVDHICSFTPRQKLTVGFPSGPMELTRSVWNIYNRLGFIQINEILETKVKLCQCVRHDTVDIDTPYGFVETNRQDGSPRNYRFFSYSVGPPRTLINQLCLAYSPALREILDHITENTYRVFITEWIFNRMDSCSNDNLFEAHSKPWTYLKRNKYRICL